MKKQHIINWSILVILTIIWGSSFILMKWGLIAYSSAEVGALRMVVSFLVLLPIIVINLKKTQLRHWKYFLIIGISGNAGPAFLFAKAQTVIDSTLAGILNSLTPLFTIIIGVLFFGTYAKWYNFLGVLIGLAGAVGLIASSGNQNFTINITYGLFVVIATIGYAINMNVIKRYLADVNSLHITSFGIASIGIPVSIFLFWQTDFFNTFIAHPKGIESFIYIALLSIVGTAMALVLLNYLIKKTNALFASSVTYLIPIVATIWGIIDHEIFHFSFYFWIPVILAGVYLANKKPKK